MRWPTIQSTILPCSSLLLTPLKSNVWNEIKYIFKIHISTSKHLLYRNNFSISDFSESFKFPIFRRRKNLKWRDIFFSSHLISSHLISSFFLHRILLFLHELNKLFQLARNTCRSMNLQGIPINFCCCNTRDLCNE